MNAFAHRWILPYALLALLTVLLSPIRARALAAAGLCLVALGGAAAWIGDDDFSGVFGAVNGFLVTAGIAIVLLAATWAWRVRGQSQPALAESRPRRLPDWLLIAGLAAATFAPHLILVAAGVFLTLVSAAATVIRSGRSRWIVVIAAGAVLLGAGFSLLFIILGPYGGRIGDLAGGPFSPPAERLLTILLGLGPLTLAGLFPFHQAPWRLSLAPLAAILLARVLIQALPEGLGDWQAPAMLWLAVALAVAAFQRRWAAALVAGGIIGMWSGRPESIFPGVITVVGGCLLDTGLLSHRTQPESPRDRAWLAAPAVALVLLLEAGLRSQVLLSVFALASAVAALSLESFRRGR